MVNLANVAVMGHITKIAVIENTNAIWEFDPGLPGNRVLGGSLDVVAALRTLVIKVYSSLVSYMILIFFLIDSILRTAYWVLWETADWMQDRHPTEDSVTQQYTLGHSIRNAWSFILLTPGEFVSLDIIFGPESSDGSCVANRYVLFICRSIIWFYYDRTPRWTCCKEDSMECLQIFWQRLGPGFRCPGYTCSMFVPSD